MPALTSGQRIDGNSRRSSDAAQPPRSKIDAQYQSMESYAPLVPMSGANCVLTAGLCERFQGPWPGTHSETQTSDFLRADQLSRGSQSGGLDFSPRAGMICCEAAAW